MERSRHLDSAVDAAVAPVFPTSALVAPVPEHVVVCFPQRVDSRLTRAVLPRAVFADEVQVSFDLVNLLLFLFEQLLHLLDLLFQFKDFQLSVGEVVVVVQPLDPPPA